MVSRVRICDGAARHVSGGEGICRPRPSGRFGALVEAGARGPDVYCRRRGVPVSAVQNQIQISGNQTAANPGAAVSKDAPHGSFSLGKNRLLDLYHGKFALEQSFCASLSGRSRVRQTSDPVKTGIGRGVGVCEIDRIAHRQIRCQREPVGCR